MQKQFFETGKTHLDHVLDVVREVIDPAFSPDCALDFGCGVGRIIIPLARQCRQVIGVDAAPTMLKVAKSHVQKSGVTNIQWASDLGALSTDLGVDFVHSSLVFQHIPKSRGLSYLDSILELLTPGGIAALQFHFIGPGGRAKRLIRSARNRVPLLNLVASRLSRKKRNASLVLMHEYPPADILRRLWARDIIGSYIETTAYDSGYTDGTIYFRKPLPAS